MRPLAPNFSVCPLRPHQRGRLTTHTLCSNPYHRGRCIGNLGQAQGLEEQRRRKTENGGKLENKEENSVWGRSAAQAVAPFSGDGFCWLSVTLQGQAEGGAVSCEQGSAQQAVTDHPPTPSPPPQEPA